jgi:hypothetical protein
LPETHVSSYSPITRPGGNLTARSTVVPHEGDIVTFCGNN